MGRQAHSQTGLEKCLDPTPTEIKLGRLSCLQRDWYQDVPSVCVWPWVQNTMKAMEVFEFFNNQSGNARWTI